jgi:Bax protein
MRFAIPKLLIFLFIAGNFSFKHAVNKPETYVNKFSPLAIKLHKETGVPASLILGIASVESGYGSSKQSRVLHNHFGMIGGSETGAKKPYKSRYHYFASDESCYRAFAQLMADKYKEPEMVSKGLTVPQIVNQIKKRYAETAYDEWAKQVNSVIKHRGYIAFDR